jgi:S1-C subfamily serine protease
MRHLIQQLLLTVICCACVWNSHAQEFAPAPQAIETAAKSVVCLYASPTADGGGSGVIIDPAGYGLTNFHVVSSMLENDRRGYGGLSDGNLYPVEVIGIDPGGDVALFRILGAERFPAAPLGDSDTLRVGQIVMAMGNPFVLAEDFSPTVTIGRISGLHRYQEGAGDGNMLEYADCIQVATSINPGNSGGPLFDARGNVIGINGRASFRTDDMAGRGRVNVGLGYAISINQIKRFLPCLRRGEMCLHGTLGMTVSQAGERVIVNAIQEGGPAAEAHLELGDHLLSIDGLPMLTPNAFNNYVATLPADHTVEITLRREERKFTVNAALEPLRVRSLGPWIPEPRHAHAAPLNLLSEQQADPEPIPADTEQINASTVKLYGARLGASVGYGSGVIVSADGKVLTAITPLLEARFVRAVLSDGREIRAEVVRRDPDRQVTLLQLEATDLPFAPLKPDSVPPAGSLVIAAGNPFNVAAGTDPVTLMFGHLAGTTRLDARFRRQDFPYRREVLLTDMVLSTPGFAGGGLYAADGALLGLIGPAVQSNRTNTWLSYALPANELQAFLAGDSAQQASDHAGERARVTLGLTLFAIGGRTQPAYIERVHLSGPARTAGLLANDLILAVDGKTVETCEDYAVIVADLPPGVPINVVYKRGDEVRSAVLRVMEIES